MNNHYAQAIDILMGKEVHVRSMCIELAKQNPELFCTLAEKTAPTNNMELADWHDEHRARDQQVRAAKIQAARAKLTPEEITLLGLDK